MGDEDAVEAKHDKKKDKYGKSKPKKAWEPPPFKVRPRFCPGDGSVAGLPDRQENELMVIKEIFAGAVEELSVTGRQISDSDVENPAQGMRPSTPVKRYRVRLSATGAGGPDAKTQGGPTAQLEVSYGRLYPMETPRLLIDKVDNLAKEAWHDLTQRVVEEVDRAAGQECVFQVCSVISELLRQHHDPSNEIPLYERMQRREAEEAKLKAEEAKLKEEAARLDREQAKKKAVDEWEKQKQAERERLERYEEKRRAVARVADGGGTLDFLPEDSELGVQGQRVPQQPEKPEKVIERCESPPLQPFRDDISSRFKGGGRVRAPSESSNEGTLPSFSCGLSSGPFVFEASVKEEPPRQVPEAKATPKLKPKSSPKMKPSSPPNRAADSKLEPFGDGNVASSGPSGRYASDFEELRLLGKGGFGTVTKARHRVDRQLYAIKRMELRGSAQERERLLQECALLPRLTHMHIVRYYQAWIETEQKEQKETVRSSGVAPKGRGPKKRAAVRTLKAAVPAEGDDWLSHPGTQAWARGASPPPGSTLLLETLYIQMEFCDGTTLREAIVSGELQKDEALIWKLFRQVLDALAYVHSKGLIHRDVKPPNIFLSKAEGGHAKLGDFGLSTELANFALEGCPPEDPGGKGGLNRQHQSTGVGTAFYMAPEVRSTHSSSPDLVSTQPYDDRVDMFSMGVVFYEMWRQPFFTAMERAQVLGKMALGLSSPDRIKEAQELLPQAPPEAAKVLASLLATDPGERMTADHLLNRSGLLPSGAFDPQVQRVLQALEDPSSSESVALLQALFNRAEEPAKDIPFFEQLFLLPQTQARMWEAEAEARDAMLQLFRDLCRKHGAVYDLCPLLRPVRREVPEGGPQSPSSAVLSKGPAMPSAVRLVDAGNTLVELRANLTEPFVRAVAARYAQREDIEDAELLQAVGQQQVRRYHVSTVYREAPSSEVYAQSQFGHPREVSSAVVQFFWQPPKSGSQQDPDSLGQFGYPRASRKALQRSMAYMQEAELLHTLAELFSTANLASRVELHLSDTRLLRLLLEAACQKAVREGAGKSGQKAPQTDAERSASSAGERLRTRLLEALRRQAAGGEKLASSQSGSSGSSAIPLGVEAPRIPTAALERAAAELSGLLAGTSSPEAPSVTAFLNEVEELYVPCNPSPASPRASGSQASAGRAESAADELKEVLRSLRALDSVLASQTTWRGVVIDPQMPVNSMYGPGLIFSVLMHLQVASPTMVCVGGRVDHLATQYMRLHAPQGTLDEVSAQHSLPGSDGLSAISAELAMDKLAAGLVQLAQGPLSQAASLNKRGKSQALASAPWWRQSAACWPTVLLGPAQEERSSGTEPMGSPWHVEAIQVASGLWRAGASCQLLPPFIDGIDPRVVSEAQKNLAQYGFDSISGPLPPDFIVTMRAEKSEKSDVKEDEEWTTRFFLRAISDQGHEAMDRAAKDAGGNREFVGRSKLLEFFERLARRHPGTASRRDNT